MARREEPSAMRHRLLAIPLLAGLLDFGENVCSSIVFGRFPRLTPGVDFLATVFTPLKWIFVVLSFGLLMAALASLMVQAITRSRRRTSQ